MCDGLKIFLCVCVIETGLEGGMEGGGGGSGGWCYLSA